MKVILHQISKLKFHLYFLADEFPLSICSSMQQMNQRVMRIFTSLFVISYLTVRTDKSELNRKCRSIFLNILYKMDK